MYFSSVCLDVWISFCLPDRYVRIFSNHTNALWHRATKFGRIARCRPLCPPPQGGKIAVCHVAHRVWYRATKIGALSPHVDRKVLTGRPRPSTTGAEPQVHFSTLFLYNFTLFDAQLANFVEVRFLGGRPLQSQRVPTQCPNFWTPVYGHIVWCIAIRFDVVTHLGEKVFRGWPLPCRRRRGLTKMRGAHCGVRVYC